MSDSFESPDAPAPKKRAVKKAAATKTVAKKAATKRVKAAVSDVPAALPTPAAPASKTVRKTAEPAAASPEPAQKAVRKTARKAAEPAAAAAVPAPAPAERPPLAAPREDRPPEAARPDTPVPEPVRHREPAAAARPPEPAPALPRPADSSAAGGAPSGGPTGRQETPARPVESGGSPPRHFQQARPPRPQHPHQPQGHPQQFQGPPGEPRFDKHPRKRRRRGRDRWKDRNGEAPAPLQGGGPSSGGGSPQGPQGGGPRQGGQPFQRPPRGEFQPRGPRPGVQDDRGENREPFVATGPPEPGSGLLEISAKGYGYLRQKSRNYLPHPQDIFVTPEMVRNYGLRDGVFLEGEIRMGQRGPQLTGLEKINGRLPENYKNLPAFEELTAINPSKRILLETEPGRATTRIIDMVAPIGKGQRGLIVAPPRAGKTTLLQHIAEAVALKYPEMKLIILLVDERPEEVTEITRAIPQAEIYASSNDAEPKNHLRIAQVAIERAKRLVEAGEDVFIVLDSITRLARASNNAIMGGGSGRTMSGGIDARALELPRRLFAAARNTREAGSLTIVGTALIETNSKADELIFQEFKGTGNMELVLDRKIAQSYVYPAVDIFKSGTRREELLLPAHQLEKINLIRRGLAGHKPIEAVERLLHFVRRHPTNAQMLLDIPKAAFVEH